MPTVFMARAVRGPSFLACREKVSLFKETTFLSSTRPLNLSWCARKTSWKSPVAMNGSRPPPHLVRVPASTCRDRHCPAPIWVSSKPPVDTRRQPSTWAATSPVLFGLGPKVRRTGNRSYLLHLFKISQSVPTLLSDSLSVPTSPALSTSSIAHI